MNVISLIHARAMENARAAETIEMEAYLWKFEEVQVDVEKKIQDRLVQRPRAVRTRTLLIIDALRLEPLVSNRR